MGEPIGRHFARCVRRDRPAVAVNWHLDEVVVLINGVKVWLWRGVDAKGDVLDILVQPRRNAKAAGRFLARRIAKTGVVTTYVNEVLSQRGSHIVSPARAAVTVA